MDCETHKIYYLKEMELKLLLAGLGAHTWYGFFSETDRRKQETKLEWEQRYHQILAGLYQKDVINWKKDQISVKKPYSDMIFIMLAQKKCVTIEGEEAWYPKQCCYIHPKEVVVTQKSQREEYTWSLQQMCISEWMQSIEEQICGLEDGQSLSLVCRNSFNGKELGRMQISQKGIRTYLGEHVLYQKQALRRKIEGWADPSFPNAQEGMQGGKRE